MGERHFLESGGKAPVIFCPKILSALPWSFGDSFNTSCYANCCPRTPFFSRARPGSLAIIQYISSRRLLSKNPETLSLFPLTKRVLLPALRLRPIIWLIPPPPPHPVMLLNDLHTLLHPTKLGLWYADSLTYILTASAVSRWAVSSNTEGEGKLNLTSPLSVAYHVKLWFKFCLLKAV